MKIAIIVLNWKQPQLTIDTINSILKIKSTGFEYQIILVDNGSPDDSVAIFQKQYSTNSKIKILSTFQNLGYAGGNNFGIDYALKHEFDYLLLINNDVIVDPDFLINLVKAAQKQATLGIFGPKIYFAPGYEFHHDRYKKSEIGHVIWSAGGHVDWNNIYGSNLGIDEVDHGQYDQPNQKIDFISGCCCLFSSEIIKKIGKLSDIYFLYLEDIDFCQRAKKNGFTLNYIPNSKIWHVNSGSSKPGGDLHEYFITRNRMIFAFKFASLRTKFAILREGVRFLFTSKSKWKRQAVIDFFLGKTGKGSWL